MTMEEAVGTKKEAMGRQTNIERCNRTGAHSHFDLVAVGTCPHCGGNLGGEVPTLGKGVKLKCSSCQHIWYLNRSIHSCKCTTCSANKKYSSLDADTRKSYNNLCAEVAQSVEQRTENPRVPSSILGLGRCESSSAVEGSLSKEEVVGRPPASASLGRASRSGGIGRRDSLKNC